MSFGTAAALAAGSPATELLYRVTPAAKAPTESKLVKTTPKRLFMIVISDKG
jgi:hypothetical protein